MAQEGLAQAGLLPFQTILQLHRPCAAGWATALHLFRFSHEALQHSMVVQLESQISWMRSGSKLHHMSAHIQCMRVEIAQRVAALRTMMSHIVDMHLSRIKARLWHPNGRLMQRRLACGS